MLRINISVNLAAFFIYLYRSDSQATVFFLDRQDLAGEFSDSLLAIAVSSMLTASQEDS